MVSLFERRSASFSPCGKYRYTLRIEWDSERPVCAFVGLNPSTATEFADDPTIVRCKGFARDWGCGTLLMLNLFAWRDTDPEAMRRAPEPIGPDNTLSHLQDHLKTASGPKIAAWGKHGTHLRRHMQAMMTIEGLSYLKMNKDGTPRHPLYLSASLKPKPLT